MKIKALEYTIIRNYLGASFLGLRVFSLEKAQ